MLKRAVLLALLAAAAAQDGGLYAEYARAREARPQQRGQMLQLVAWAAGGFGLSHLWSRAHKRKLVNQHQAEKRKYATALQEADARLKEQDAKIRMLSRDLYNMELDNLERDLAEFKAPDSNGDDQITKPEFMAYMQNYVASQPGLALEDFPTFEEWDLNSNGKVTFQEWQQVMEFLEEGGQTASQQKAGADKALFTGRKAA
uniref:EF-hand domain-containing protein n=2 Tax=Pinguiococcus pyrenoidosus TaxID=172671 RepID=A0A7R9UEI5_9STRA|mmetsp:Transcript_7864/g.29467  ORF Transcript_7864/g.29467 Transcript_7864/m.29467 type:complete len:202 (+) Transcript_7864:87-692(+)